MKKNNLVTMGVSFLLCVGMVGAGFASWVISADVTEEGKSTVSVEEVIDQRLGSMQIATDQDSSGWNKGGDEVWNADLHFGAPATKDSFDSPWLTNSNGTTEDLDVYLGVVFSYTNLFDLSENNFTAIELTFDLDSASESLLDGYDDYVVEPTTFALATTPTSGEFMPNKSDLNANLETPVSVELYNYVKENTVTFAKDENGIFKATIKIADLIAQAREEANANANGNNEAYLKEFRFKYVFKFTYTWGEIFGNENPYNYFNAFGSGEKITTEGDTYKDQTYAAKALDTLTKLAELNADQITGNFKIKVTGKPVVAVNA